MSEVTQAQTQPQIEKQPKPLSPEQYLKTLEKYHRQVKLQCEVAEYEFRRVIAQNEMNKFRNELMQAQQASEAAEQRDVANSAPQDPDVDVLTETKEV